MTMYENTANLLDNPDGPIPELQNIVIDARGSINGSADPWPRESLQKALDVLKYKTENWKPGLPNDKIDTLVYFMCIEGIAIIEKELKSRIKTGFNY